MEVLTMQTVGPCTFHYRLTPNFYYQSHTFRGESIFASRNRTREVTTAVVQKFPPVPDNLSDFDRLSLSRRPTFFGCDPKENPAEYPLMIYIANAPPADGSDPVSK
jgi:lysophospholipase